MGDLPLITAVEHYVFWLLSESRLSDTSAREGKDRSQNTCFRQDIWMPYTELSRLLECLPSLSKTQREYPGHNNSREKELLYTWTQLINSVNDKKTPWHRTDWAQCFEKQTWEFSGTSCSGNYSISSKDHLNFLKKKLKIKKQIWFIII